jgi:predicted metal-dependent hydrolase
MRGSQVPRSVVDKRGARPQLRARHPLAPGEEHDFLVAGSRLFNARAFYETHEEWEEVWRRATGSRREMLRGLIQIAVGYEHLKRGNDVGARSLLRQGVRRLRPRTRARGVRELIDRAQHDIERLVADPSLTIRRIAPPKVMVRLRGFDAGAPAGAIEIEVSRGRRAPGAARR